MPVARIKIVGNSRDATVTIVFRGKIRQGILVWVLKIITNHIAWTIKLLERCLASGERRQCNIATTASTKTVGACSHASPPTQRRNGISDLSKSTNRYLIGRTTIIHSVDPPDTIVTSMGTWVSADGPTHDASMCEASWEGRGQVRKPLLVILKACASMTVTLKESKIPVCFQEGICCISTRVMSLSVNV